MPMPAMEKRAAEDGSDQAGQLKRKDSIHPEPRRDNEMIDDPATATGADNEKKGIPTPCASRTSTDFDKGAQLQTIQSRERRLPSETTTQLQYHPSCTDADIQSRCSRPDFHSSIETPPTTLVINFKPQPTPSADTRPNDLDDQQSDTILPLTGSSTGSSAALSPCLTASHDAPSIASSFTSLGTNFTSASEILHTIRSSPDIGGRRPNPKLARVANWSDPHYAASVVRSSRSIASSQPLAKALGKRAIGRTTLPPHIAEYALSEYSRPSSSRGSDRTARTTASSVVPRSCLSSNTTGHIKRNPASKVSFAADAPPVLQLPAVPKRPPPVPSQSSQLIEISPRPSALDDVKNASAPRTIHNDANSFESSNHSTTNLVPLSDACPFLSGPLHLRDSLDRTAPHRDGNVKIEQLLRGRGIDPGQVSRRDWILVWHLSMAEAGRKGNTKGVPTAPLMLPMFFFWLRSATEMERVQLTVDDFIKWVQSKQEGEKQLQHWDIQAAGQKRYGGLISEIPSREPPPPGEVTASVPSASNPLGIWSEIYQLLRSRGMQEKRMEKEDLAQLILLPREERLQFLESLAAKQRLLPSDDASVTSASSSLRSIAVSSSASNADRAQRRLKDGPNGKQADAPISRIDWAGRESSHEQTTMQIASGIGAPERLWAYHNSRIERSSSARPLACLPSVEQFAMTNPDLRPQKPARLGELVKDSADREKRKKKDFFGWLTARLRQWHFM